MNALACRCGTPFVAGPGTRSQSSCRPVVCSGGGGGCYKHPGPAQGLTASTFPYVGPGHWACRLLARACGRHFASSCPSRGGCCIQQQQCRPDQCSSRNGAGCPDAPCQLVPPATAATACKQPLTAQGRGRSSKPACSPVTPSHHHQCNRRQWPAAVSGGHGSRGWRTQHPAVHSRPCVCARQWRCPACGSSSGSSACRVHRNVRHCQRSAAGPACRRQLQRVKGALGGGGWEWPLQTHASYVPPTPCLAFHLLFTFPQNMADLRLKFDVLSGFQQTVRSLSRYPV